MQSNDVIEVVTPLGGGFLQCPACHFCASGGQIRRGGHQDRLGIGGRSGKVGGARRKAQARFPGRLRRRCTSGSAATGAFVNDAPVYPQATGFVLNPEGPIVTAVYSIGAIGRHDVLRLVRTSYLRQRAEEQRQIGGEVDGWRSRL
jgi:hypothetical protein